MPEDAPRPAPAAIRTALGAIFVSLELSRRTWLIRAARAVPRTPRQLPAFRYRVLEFGPTEIFPPVGAMHRAIPVSADRAAPAGPTHPRERPASRRERPKSRETWTLRWSGMDSNFRFRARMATVPSLRALSISLKLFGFRRRTCRPQGPKFRIRFRSSSESSELRSRDRRPERRDLGFGADRGHVARWPARRRLLDWAILAGYLVSAEKNRERRWMAFFLS